MRRPTHARTESGEAPYERLRRARAGALRHRDDAGLRALADDYFSLADELELDDLFPKRPSRAA